MPPVRKKKAPAKPTPALPIDALPKVVQESPSEVAGGLVIAGAVYGFLTQAAAPNAAAAFVAVVVGFTPLLVKRIVDSLRK